MFDITIEDGIAKNILLIRADKMNERTLSVRGKSIFGLFSMLKERNFNNPFAITHFLLEKT